MTRAQDGDVAAFEHLVHAYQADLFRLAYRMLFDRGAAEDAVQETFVAVWRRLPSLVDPLAFRAWIYHIASRRCLNVLRVRSRQRTEVTRGPDFEHETQSRSRSAAAAGDDDPAVAAQTRATRRGLDEVLATLPPDQRVCWVLHELHELSYAAIAYAIGVPLSTVRGRISRARQNLANGMSSWR